MNNTEKVRVVMERNAGRMRVSQIMAEADLEKTQVYSALFILRHKKAVKASEPVSQGVYGGVEKYYWIADLDEALGESDRIDNVPLVAHAMRHIARHAGNPFAGLMGHHHG